MTIAIAQLNYKVGDLDYNFCKIKTAIEKAITEQAEIIIFSELAITGYTPMDLLYNKNFVNQAIAKIEELSQYCINITAIIGGPSISNKLKGKPLQNSAWIINEQGAKVVASKTFLTTNEYRHFQPNDNFNVVNVNRKRIAITIGEDLWDDKQTDNWQEKNHYNHISPTQKLAALKPDYIINISALPFAYDKIEERNSVISNKAQNYGTPILHINQVGGNAQFIYEGSSKIVLPNGEITHQLPAFEEEVRIIKNIETKKETESTDEISLIHRALILGIRDFFNKSGFKKAVLGLSGGLDSALVAALVAEAIGNENVHGILMPSVYSTDHSITDAVDLANNLNISYDIIPIKDLFNSFNTSLKDVFSDKPVNVTEENIQARIRGTILMAYSNKFGHILLNTSNKSEAAVGYGTLYGDMNGSLSVIGDLYKSRAFELSRYINKEKEIIPTNTITKPPSAELSPNQQDSDSLPDYDILDAILFNHIEKGKSAEALISEGYNPEIVKRALNLLNNSDFKRYQSPPVLHISSNPIRSSREIPLNGKTNFS